MELEPVTVRHAASVPAGRQAIDLRRVGADEPYAGRSQLLEPRKVEALCLEDRPLVARPAKRVLPDGPVTPDDPVTRHDERDRVVAERRTHRTDGLRTTDLGGDPAVRPHLATRDLERLQPDVSFEFRVAAEIEVDMGPAIAVEPPRDRRRQSGWQRPGAVRRSPGPSPVVGFEGAVVVSGLDRRDAASIPGDDERADRRVEPRIEIGQTHLGEDAGPERCGSARAQGGHRRFDVLVGGGHAVILSRSRRSAASYAVRSRASPRWTWAFTVPSGRSSAAASSG